MTRVIAIIQARIGSIRLPGKVLKKICEREILDYVISRVKKSKKIDEVIVATSTLKKDDVINDFCLKKNCVVFRGSEIDVLDRFYQCAKKHSGDIIVRLTADCPLVDWNVIDYYIDYYLNNDIDYVVNSWFKNAYPSGFDVEVFSFDTLERYWKYEKDVSKREHVCSYIKEHKEMFKYSQHSNIKNTIKYNHNYLHLSIDTKKDYLLVKNILEHFEGDENITFQQIMNYIPDKMIFINIDKERHKKIKEIKNL